MIPKPEFLIEDFTVAEEPSNTYCLNYEKHRVTGYTDGLAAIKQAIYKLLNTEKYQYLIYSWGYGVELADLIGKERSFVIPEIERRITEALMTDERILGISEFNFDINKSKYHVQFSVQTEFGDLNIESEVDI